MSVVENGVMNCSFVGYFPLCASISATAYRIIFVISRYISHGVGRIIFFLSAVLYTLFISSGNASVYRKLYTLIAPKCTSYGPSNAYNNKQSIYIGCMMIVIHFLDFTSLGHA